MRRIQKTILKHWIKARFKVELERMVISSVQMSRMLKENMHGEQLLGPGPAQDYQ